MIFNQPASITILNFNIPLEITLFTIEPQSSALFTHNSYVVLVRSDFLTRSSKWVFTKNLLCTRNTARITIVNKAWGALFLYSLQSRKERYSLVKSYTDKRKIAIVVGIKEKIVVYWLSGKFLLSKWQWRTSIRVFPRQRRKPLTRDTMLILETYFT